MNPNGVRPIEIQQRAPDTLVVQARGEIGIEQLRSWVTPSGELTFHLVSDASTYEDLPPGTMIAPPYAKGDEPLVVEQRPVMGGEHLARANASTSAQTGEFVLSFELDVIGARAFCQATEEYAGRRFAILFDGRVLTAPYIIEPICGGSGQISGNFTAESATELAILLRAGALPAPLTVIQQGTGLAPPAEPTP